MGAKRSFDYLAKHDVQNARFTIDVHIIVAISRYNASGKEKKDESMASNITQEDLDWIHEGVIFHLDEMMKQLTAYMQGVQPEGQTTTPRNKARYEAHAIEYLLADVKNNLQYGKPIPKVIVDEGNGRKE